MKPLAIDLFCGLGGWTDGLLAEGWDVVGFDIEEHVYGSHRYPAGLVIQDVRTMWGAALSRADLIVASPPCQAYSYRAMPWSRAKALPPPDNTLFEQPFRIQREASEAKGRHIPLVVENVRGAQKWVGRARWNYGSFYLWGDVPALMPFSRITGPEFSKNSGSPRWNNYKDFGEVSASWTTSGRKGIKQHGSGREWFAGEGKISRMTSSKSPARKMASAMIAKIPEPLARHIARVFKP